jgi:molybdenum cofactor synthesis domain-containing protein
MTGKTPLRAGILIIGNEVLDGLVLDTNSNWMELRLSSLSVPLTRLACVRDEPEEIAKGLSYIREGCNLVITSGGLGPTHDDMTLSAIGQALGLEMSESEEALAIVIRQYKMLSKKGIVQHSDITPPRRKMAVIPQGAIPLDNTVGGAPGVRIQDGSTSIFCLPGVPAELKDIFTSSVEPWIKTQVTDHYHERVVEFKMKDESEFAPVIDRVMKKHPGVYIKSMPKRYGTSKVLQVWISARGEDLQKIEKIVSSAITSISVETSVEPDEDTKGR